MTPDLTEGSQLIFVGPNWSVRGTHMTVGKLPLGDILSLFALSADVV